MATSSWGDGKMVQRFVVVMLALSASFVMVTPVSAQTVSEVTEKKNWIPVYVTPYYSAADTHDGAPRVAVNNGLNELLSSTKASDIIAGRDLVESNPATVTPF